MPCLQASQWSAWGRRGQGAAQPPVPHTENMGQSEKKEARFWRSRFFTIKTLPAFAVSLIYCSVLLTRTSCLMPREPGSPTGSQGCFQPGSFLLAEATSANSLLHQSTASLPGDKMSAGGICEGHSSPAQPAVQKGDIGHVTTAGHPLLR